MINPCAVKGISIFLELAARCPDVAFGALPGWGTTAADRRALEALPNVTLLPNCRRHRRGARARTRVLLMPSLWYEGFGLIVMEAMLRGIPVIASDSGGLVEAKMGTGFVIPVPPIERYEPVFDERGMPRPVRAGLRRAAVGRGAARPAFGTASCTKPKRKPRGRRRCASFPACAPETRCEELAASSRRRPRRCASCWRTTRSTTRRTAAATNPTAC